MNTPTPRYIEIFEERAENGKSVLRYHGFDNKMHEVCEQVKSNLEKVVDSLKSSSFANGVPALDWADTKYTVTYSGSNASIDFPYARVSGSFNATLKANSGYKITACSVTMGGSSVANAYTPKGTGTITEGTISIANVTGDISISATIASA